MANYRNENNGLINLPLYCITNWIWCDIKKFLKISQMAGSKKLTSAGGRKLRFCQYIVLTKSACWWNIPTPLFNFKIAALTKNINFKFQNNRKSVNAWLTFFDISDIRRKYFFNFSACKKNYNGSVWEFGLLNCMIGISKHILLDNNDIFKEFKNSVTEQLQNGFVDWWRRENYSDRSQGRRKSQSQKFEDVQRKNMIRLFA